MAFILFSWILFKGGLSPFAYIQALPENSPATKHLQFYEAWTHPLSSIKCGARKAKPRCYLCSGWSGAWLSSVCIWDPSIHCFYFVSSTATWFWNLLLDRISAKNQSFIKNSYSNTAINTICITCITQTSVEKLMTEAAWRYHLVQEKWLGVNKHSASRPYSLPTFHCSSHISFSYLSVF